MSVNLIAVCKDNKRKYLTNQYCYAQVLDSMMYSDPVRYVELYFVDSNLNNEDLKAVLCILVELFKYCDETRDIVKDNDSDEVQTTCKVRVNIEGNRMYNVLFVLWTFRLISNNRSALGNFPDRDISNKHPSEITRQTANKANLVKMIYGLTHLPTNQAILQLILYQHGGIYAEELYHSDASLKNYMVQGEASYPGRFPGTRNRLVTKQLPTTSYSRTEVTIAPFTVRNNFSWTDFLDSMYRGYFSSALVDEICQLGAFKTLAKVNKINNPVFTYDNMEDVLINKRITEFFEGDQHGTSQDYIEYLIFYSNYPNRLIHGRVQQGDYISTVRDSHVMRSYELVEVEPLPSYRLVDDY